MVRRRAQNDVRALFNETVVKCSNEQVTDGVSEEYAVSSPSVPRQVRPLSNNRHRSGVATGKANGKERLNENQRLNAATQRRIQAKREETQRQAQTASRGSCAQVGGRARHVR